MCVRYQILVCTCEFDHAHVPVGSPTMCVHCHVNAWCTLRNLVTKAWAAGGTFLPFDHTRPLLTSHA